MKPLTPFMCILLTAAINATAQIKIPTRTTTQQQNTTIQQTQTTVPVTKTATNMVEKTNTSVANNLSTTYTMPDGNRMSIFLKKNAANFPQNFGGTVNEKVHNKTEGSSADMDCVTEVRTISAQSASFMNVNYSSQSIHLYPGAIYKFNEFFSGNYRPVEQGRTPITIRTDNLANTTGPVFQTINDPNAGNISTGINAIIQPFSTSNGSSNLQFRIFQSENDAELAIKLSAGGGYGGFKASGGFNFSQTEKKFFLTIDVIKPMYSITTSVPANGYFNDPSFVAANPQLIVLQSVTYGTRILANVEITINTQEDAANFKASFGKEGEVSANASVTFEYLKKSRSASSTINGFVVGGPLQTTIFNKDKLLEEITSLLTQCNYQSARPIAYSFADMNGNVMGVETATDKFPVVKCTPKGTVQYLTGATVQIMTAEKKEQGSNASVDLFNSNNQLLFDNNQNNTEFTGQNDIVLNKRNISNEYFLETGFGKSGGYIDIFFEPKQTVFEWDAWKINQVTLLLYFKDQYGTPSTKSIQFQTNVNLQKNQQRLRLPFSNLYQPGSAYLVE